MADLILTLGTPARVFYSIMLGLDSAIYWFIDVIYTVFMTICNTQLFSATTFEAFSTRIYAIMGVVMLFVVISQLLANIADPDKAISGEAGAGKLVKNIIISLIAIVLLPTVFKYLYVIQNAVLQENVIGNIIVGGYAASTSADASTMIKKAGKKIAFSTFTAFMSPTGYSGNNDVACEGSPLTYCLMYSLVSDYGSNSYAKIALFNNDIVINEIDNGEVDYKTPLATIAGLAVAYFLLSFSIDMGVRVAKLAYYQLIAPVPIILRIVPKKQDVFDNWVKGLTGTYLGVFIRLMVVYFCLFLISILPSAIGNVLAAGNNTPAIVDSLITIILIFGIFIFMKEAPKLISQMLGVSDGDMSLGIGKKLAGAAIIGGAVVGAQKLGKKYGNKALGAATGALGGGWNSMVNGEGFGAGFRVGGLGGFDAGGWQGKNQANEIHRARYGNPKAKAGLFGGDSLGTKYRGATKKLRETSFAAGAQGRIDAAKTDAYKKMEAIEKRNLETDIMQKQHDDPNSRYNKMTTTEINKEVNSALNTTMKGLATRAASDDIDTRLSVMEEISSRGGGEREYKELRETGKAYLKEQDREKNVSEARAKDDAAKFMEKVYMDAAKAKTPEAPAADPGAKK